MPDETHPRQKEDGSAMSTARNVKYERAEGLRIPHILSPKDRLQDKLRPKESIFAQLFRGGLIVSTSESKPGVQIPYPILAVIAALFMWLAGITGGAIYIFGSMNSTLNGINTSLMQREIRDAEHNKKLEEDMRLQWTYVQNDRERIIKLEAQQRGRN